MVIPLIIGTLETIPKENRGLGNQRISRDHPDYSIIKIAQNTETSSRDLRRLPVTQTPVKKPSAYAGVKNSQRIKIITQ